MKSRLQSALLFVGTIDCNRLSSYVYLSCLAALEARNFSANSEPGLKFWVQGLGKDFNGGWERVSRNPKPERHRVEASVPSVPTVTYRTNWSFQASYLDISL